MKVPLSFKILDINKDEQKNKTQNIKTYISHNTYTILEITKKKIKLTIIFITRMLKWFVYYLTY